MKHQLKGELYFWSSGMRPEDIVTETKDSVRKQVAILFKNNFLKIQGEQE